MLADRAALVLDTHLRTLATTSYKLDPYATKSPKVSAADPKVERLLRRAIGRAEIVLRRHPLPGHLMNALLRDRDPETVANSRKVQEEIAREAAEEKSRRGRTTIPPPARGEGGSKDTAA